MSKYKTLSNQISYSTLFQENPMPNRSHINNHPDRQ